MTTRKTHTVLIGAIFLSIATAAATASAGPSAWQETFYQARFNADPSVAPMPPNQQFCAQAPFSANAYVEGPLTEYELTGTNALIDHPPVVGYAQACLQVTDPTFTPFQSPVKIYWKFTLDGVGDFAGDGLCYPSSNNIPENGLILGGCILKLTQLPAGFTGGNLVESGNLFNPFGIPDWGIASSIFTVHLFAPAN